MGQDLLSLAERDKYEKLYQSMQELKLEKDRNRLKNHRPLPGTWQEKFDVSQSKGRFMMVGNQGGKTLKLCVEVGRYALGEHPHKKIRVPNVGVLVSAQGFQEGIVKNVLPKLEAAVGSEDIKRIQRNSQGIPTSIYWRSGSVTYLMSAEQDDQAFEGITLDYFAIDEPLRRQIYIALSRGLMKSDGHWWWAATLLNEPWIFEDIYLPCKDGKLKSVQIFEGTTDDNTTLSGEAKEEYFSKLSDDEKEVRRLGKPSAMQGRVFKSYDPTKNRIPSFDIPSHWPVYVSIDPHPNKPHAVLFIAVSPNDDLYACNEIFVKCDIYQLAEHIIDIEQQYNVVQRLIDTSAQQDDWSKKSAREMLAEKPYNIRTKLAQKKNKKKSRISLLNQFLKNAHNSQGPGQKFYVMEHCHRLHKEFLYQRYKESKRDKQLILEEPEKKWDDMTDDAGYIITERPRYRGHAKILSHGPLYSEGA